MRSRTFLFTVLSVASVVAAPLAAHAAIPFFGPVVPTAYNVCPASWGLLITVVNNIISLLITLAIVFVAPLMIAYAGFLFVVNPVNAGGKEQAKGILLHTIVGIVVALAGWMIVDAAMAVLYNPAAVGSTWSSLIQSNGLNDACLNVAGSLNSTKGQIPATGVSATGAVNTPPPGKSGTACDPAVVTAAAATGGYTLTPVQANIFACIAQPESTCGTRNLNFSWNKANAEGKASTAAGAFQVLLSTNHSCYENAPCRQAAGVSGTLDCQKGFGPNGFTAGGDPAVLDYCVKAAANLNCSASAAACLLEKNNGNFSPWQADVRSQQQTGCITTGG